MKHTTEYSIILFAANKKSLSFFYTNVTDWKASFLSYHTNLSFFPARPTLFLHAQLFFPKQHVHQTFILGNPLAFSDFFELPVRIRKVFSPVRPQFLHLK